MFHNLLTNAIQFTKKKGQVRVNVKLIQQINSKLQTISISVTDNGIGIKNNCKDKIFTLFGNIKNKRKLNTEGIGLGLVICKLIVHCFGGQISFKSLYKHQTTFEFTFSNVQFDLIQ